MNKNKRNRQRRNRKRKPVRYNKNGIRQQGDRPPRRRVFPGERKGN